MHVKPEHGFRPIVVLKRFTQLRDSNVKYKFIFYKVSSAPSPLPLLKLPNIRDGNGTTMPPNKRFNELGRVVRKSVNVNPGLNVN